MKMNLLICGLVTAAVWIVPISGSIPVVQSTQNRGYTATRSDLPCLGPGRSTTREQRAHLTAEEARIVDTRFRAFIAGERYVEITPLNWRIFIDRNPHLAPRLCIAPRVRNGNYLLSREHLLEVYEATREIPDRESFAPEPLPPLLQPEAPLDHTT